MGRVVKFEDKRPWRRGTVVCSSCSHRWVASAPSRAQVFECPKCNKNRGFYESYDPDGAA